MKKKLAVITATRAEYGLLNPLIKQLSGDAFFDCHVIVTGTHLVKKYGYTINQILDDQIAVAHTIHILSENENNPAEVIATAIREFSALYEAEQYDGIILLGDRFELYGFAIPALLLNIPIIHIHGGERTEGAVDEKIRHSITKMSSIHFPSIEEYRKRIIQMGEMPENVYAVGALGIDNIANLPLYNRAELEHKLQIDFRQDVAVVTFHPVTLETPEESARQVAALMDALLQSSLFSIITMPNCDVGGDAILKIILKYVEQYGNRFRFIKSLGQKNYLSCLKYARLVIGNSSSGIIETASFHLPAINIGDRQKGRFAPENVIHCSCEPDSIKSAIALGLSQDFRNSLIGCTNPYGDGHTAEKIADTLKGLNWDCVKLVKKEFYDINFEV